jgi:RNA polymerase sigma factor (sigma-70 family)
MVAVLVESEKPDSELVIGSNLKSPCSETENEQTLIQMVKNRAALYKQKPGRTQFTPSDHWIDKRGDRALTQLLNLHNRRICSLVAKQQDGSADADLKQEAITAFIEAIYLYDPSKGAALYSYAYFRIMDRLQQIKGRNNRNEIATGRSFAEVEGYDYPDLKDIYQHEALSAAVALLPERQQRVIWMRQAEVSFAAIAHQFNLALKSVQNLYYEGIKKLRTTLDKVLPCVLPVQIAEAPVEIAVLEVVHEPVVEQRAVIECESEQRKSEVNIPEFKPQGGFKILWGLFAKEPITNLEPIKRSKFSQYSIHLDLLLDPLMETPMIYDTKSTQLQNRQPTWCSFFSIGLGYGGDRFDQKQHNKCASFHSPEDWDVPAVY